MGGNHSLNRYNTQLKPAQQGRGKIPGQVDDANKQLNLDANQPRITLDEAYESLEEYKEAINNVYSLSQLLDDYVDEIRDKLNDGDQNPINSVLLTTLHEGYNKSEAKNYCEILELGTNIETVRRARMLFSCKQYEELDGRSVFEMRSNNSTELIDGVPCSMLGQLLETRLVDVSKKLPAYGQTYIYANLGLWTHGVRAYFNLIRRDPLMRERWIVVSSGVNISNYTNINVNNMQTFSREYKILMDSITQVMNSNTYINVIEESARHASKDAEDAIANLEEKNAVYKFATQVLESAPTDMYAKSKQADAKMEAHIASRTAAAAVTTAKAAQSTLNEAEAHIATRTTTWEYGSSETYDTLRCVYSGIHPQWNGMYIKDCNLNNPNSDIANTTFNVMADIAHYYPDLYHGQVVLSTYKINDLYYTAVVKVIIRGEETHIQMKEAQLNLIFPSQAQMRGGNQAQPAGSPTPSGQYIFIDPSRRYIGIGTGEYQVQYEDEYATVARDRGQNVVIQSATYPNLVGTRIAENSGHIPGGGREKNLYYFDQFSSATMRRHSNLYTFEQMYKYAVEGNDPDGDFTSMRKYGSDISFEITDRSKMTKEIGNIGMVIDKIDQEGKICGGLSVKTVPDVVVINGRETVRPGGTIMYVSSDGILSINGIMLGSKELRVNRDAEGNEELMWGETRIC
jgi:hypothetical protein